MERLNALVNFLAVALTLAFLGALLLPAAPPPVPESGRTHRERCGYAGRPGDFAEYGIQEGKPLPAEYLRELQRRRAECERERSKGAR